MSNTVSIAKALKIKSRLAKELADCELLLKTRNCERFQIKDGGINQEFKTNFKEKYDEYHTLQNKMLELKSEISKANIPIIPTMEKMNQLKAEISMLGGVSCLDDETTEAYGNTVKEYKWVSQFDKLEIEAKKKELQSEIDKLQDALDEFNAVTRITISF